MTRLVIFIATHKIIQLKQTALIRLTKIYILITNENARSNSPRPLRLLGGEAICS